MKKCVRFDPSQLAKLAVTSLAVAAEVAIIVVAVRNIIKRVRTHRGR